MGRLGLKQFAWLVRLLAGVTFFSIFANPVWGGAADIVNAEISRNPNGDYDFTVTVRHADSGWDHYADRWDVITLDGETLGTRVLLHPHENEQPFTRSLRGVAIPEGIVEVIIRARDSLHGYGGKELNVRLDR
ncbi:MAG: hypothetical protein AAFY56_09945 [Pseudomonadota bacterium]